MAILNAQGISQAFGGFSIFRDVSVSIERDAKIGLVGPNGVGKTTLLKILAGLLESTTGYVNLSRGVQIGYLRQEAMEAFSEMHHTLLEEMLSVFEGVQLQEQRMRELEGLMADPSADQTAVMDEYSHLQEEFDRIGGYDYEVRIEQTLGGLGFREDQFDTPLSHLSGGQKTRALLARLLLERPHLLILDEPTNHLDVQAIEWLEKALVKWKGALLIVSHDRYFLDRVATHIWELSQEGLEAYRGNYSAYLMQREERHEYHLKLYRQEKERLERELDFIKRNISNKAHNGAAVGRLRRLSRDLAAIEQMGLVAYLSTSQWSQTGVGNVRPYSVSEADKAIRAIPSPVKSSFKLNAALRTIRRSGEYVLRTRGLRVGYPERPLFTADDLRLERGEVAALIGGNGTGKTTLLKTVMGELPQLAGKFWHGQNVQIGYFSQSRNDLDESRTVMNAVSDDRFIPEQDLRQLLAQYLFRGDDVFKLVSDLSGGERARLALARLALQGANFLLLDEPTNHLDIPAQEILQDVLQQYEGTILLVSHDRYLIERMATQIWHVEDGHMRVFLGDYAAYNAVIEQEAAEGIVYQPNFEPVDGSDDDDMPDARTFDTTRLDAQIAALRATVQEFDMLASRARADADRQRLTLQRDEGQAKLDALLAERQLATRQPVEN
jgi:ATP-binding cassette subfamily F protein 3